MQIKDQSLVLGHYKGAPVRFHWSILLGMAYFGGFQFAPGFWLGFCLLILCHELGHGFLVQLFGLKINDIVVHGFGGHCEWLGRANKIQESIIAWGGVLAQGILLAITLIVFQVKGPPATIFEAELYSVMTRTNIILMLFNLIPIPPLDGARAWRLFPLLLKGKRK